MEIHFVGTNCFGWHDEVVSRVHLNNGSSQNISTNNLITFFSVYLSNSFLLAMADPEGWGQGVSNSLENNRNTLLH